MVENDYERSVKALEKYIKQNEKNPTEKVWDLIAIKEGYLSSRSIGYLSGEGFNIFCKSIRKQQKKEKEEKN